MYHVGAAASEWGEAQVPVALIPGREDLSLRVKLRVRPPQPRPRQRLAWTGPRRGQAERCVLPLRHGPQPRELVGRAAPWVSAGGLNGSSLGTLFLPFTFERRRLHEGLGALLIEGNTRSFLQLDFLGKHPKIMKAATCSYLSLRLNQKT